MFNPGDRVFVAYENSNGTVVEDHSFDERGDFGVDVRLDSDGMIVSCAHAQLTRLEE